MRIAGRKATAPGRQPAVLSVMNVRVSDAPVPDSIPVKWMRIVQVFPKSTPLGWDPVPRMGYGKRELGRMSLGVVPVEADGSVYCYAPVGKEMYFQLLDERGTAITTMMSGAYVHAGEHLSCVGCHEDKWTAPSVSSRPLAMSRPPSVPQPEWGSAIEPLTYYRTVKPIFENTCLPCHRRSSKLCVVHQAFTLHNRAIILHIINHGFSRNSRSESWGLKRIFPVEISCNFSRARSFIAKSASTYWQHVEAAAPHTPFRWS